MTAIQYLAAQDGHIRHVRFYAVGAYTFVLYTLETQYLRQYPEIIAEHDGVAYACTRPASAVECAALEQTPGLLLGLTRSRLA